MTFHFQVKFWKQIWKLPRGCATETGHLCNVPALTCSLQESGFTGERGDVPGLPKHSRSFQVRWAQRDPFALFVSKTTSVGPAPKISEENDLLNWQLSQVAEYMGEKWFPSCMPSSCSLQWGPVLCWGRVRTPNRSVMGCFGQRIDRCWLEVLRDSADLAGALKIDLHLLLASALPSKSCPRV